MANIANMAVKIGFDGGQALAGLRPAARLPRNRRGIA